MKNKLLENKIIVVAGGAGLLGQGIIKAIIENGGIAIMGDINEDIGKLLEKKLQQELNTKNILFVKLDITSKESIQNCISFLNKKFNRIDALVNSAYPRNKNYGRQFFEVEYQDFCENLSLHLGGYFLASQQFALFFKKQGYGNIVLISSIYGVIAPRFEIYEGSTYQGIPMTVPVEYACIKSAIIHLTKYMAKYFKGLNIRVNCVSPGGILSGQPEPFLSNYKKFCLNKGMLDVEDIVGTVIFLLSDESKYINGQNIIVDDGFCL